MMDQIQTMAGSKPEHARRGVFLPSMAWTNDPRDVENEKQRLLLIQKQLSALVASARKSDDCATWHLMAEASLSQLDRDIDDIFEWLKSSERGRKPASD